MISWYSLKNSMPLMCFFNITSSLGFLVFTGILMISNGSLISQFLISTKVVSQKNLKSGFRESSFGKIVTCSGTFPLHSSFLILAASNLKFAFIVSFF